MTRQLRSEAGLTLVEMLVVLVILGIVGTATVSVVVATSRTQQFTSSMQEVIDDGRVSLARIRRELRTARRVLEGSCESVSACDPSSRLHFWVDQNQNRSPEAVEFICYLTESIGTGQWQLVRWDGADTGCSAATRPARATVLAKTLVDPLPFKDFEAEPTADPDDAETRLVTVLLELEVLGRRGPDSVKVEATVRLRNVA